MIGMDGTATLAAELEQAVDQLHVISRRVADAGAAAPSRDASGWNGLAAWAYQQALDELSHDLETAQALLRSATDLTAAALFEVGGHA
jgi:uncharacterized protein YukE